MYMKLKDDWSAFKAYKLPEEVKARSEKITKNAKKKKYNHTMGPGGYAQGKPKWAHLEADYIAKGITPEPYHWESRVRDWYQIRSSSIIKRHGKSFLRFSIFKFLWIFEYKRKTKQDKNKLSKSKLSKTQLNRNKLSTIKLDKSKLDKTK